MKVLAVHNYYQSTSPSGEDRSFENEVSLLKKNGIDVYTYTRRNDEIAEYGTFEKFRLPFETLWSVRTYRELHRLLKQEKPDIAHFHNIWYLVSPSAYYACKDTGIPVVQTLHNYRFFCANGLLFRDGTVCESCLGKLALKGIVNGCYRNSRLYSTPIAIVESIHRICRTLDKMVNAYIALTESSKQKYIECGILPDRLFVKPNTIMNVPAPQYSGKSAVVFVGRLTEEKGIDTLIAAAKHLRSCYTKHLKIRIIGDGPYRKYLDDIMKTETADNMELIGHKEYSEIVNRIRQARFVVVPSICYESFPLVVAEAYACGKPVVASRIGALAELVKDGETGLLFEPGDAVDLAAKVKWLYEHRDICRQMGINSRRVFDEKYSANKNHELLMQIYRSVLSNH